MITEVQDTVASMHAQGRKSKGVVPVYELRLCCRFACVQNTRLHLGLYVYKPRLGFGVCIYVCYCYFVYSQITCIVTSVTYPMAKQSSPHKINITLHSALQIGLLITLVTECHTLLYIISDLHIFKKRQSYYIMKSTLLILVTSNNFLTYSHLYGNDTLHNKIVLQAACYSFFINPPSNTDYCSEAPMPL